MASRKLIVVSAGAFAREVVWAARDATEPWDVFGYLDDNTQIHGTQICDAPVLGSVEQWCDFPDAQFVVAIGQPRARRTVVEKMRQRGTPRFGTVIHHSVQKSSYVDVGEGSIICANTVLTTQVKVGAHAIINLSCTVGHDVTTGAYCTFAPLVACSGSVKFGSGVEVGTAAVIRQGLALGDGAMLGMGSVLTKNIPAGGLWVGNPARAIRDLPLWPSEAS
jgi:sugar O-acyltransferase (sialic acid O-acetyltransferase NeuD family)